MFETADIKSDEHLIDLVNSVRTKIKNNIIEVTYPEVLKQRSGKKIWEDLYKEIDSLNEKLLKSIESRGGIYIIFSAKPNEEWELKYIGQVKSTGTRQRIRSHLIWRNKDTKSGKSTGSKFDEVMSKVTKGHDIAFSFVEINPESLRHYVEEILINKCQPSWNYNGTNLTGQNSRKNRRYL
ncbi:MAG: GIY-YIG nuclease family protein [Desulfobacter sp.]|nr:MAG: GIY-YIG nuclease family protein [Desulfobacter sp.]